MEVGAMITTIHDAAEAAGAASPAVGVPLAGRRRAVAAAIVRRRYELGAARLLVLPTARRRRGTFAKPSG